MLYKPLDPQLNKWTKDFIMPQHQNGSMVGISMAMAWHWQPVLKASAPSHVLFWNRRHHWHRQPLQPDTLLGATNQLLANFWHPCLSFPLMNAKDSNLLLGKSCPKAKRSTCRGESDSAAHNGKWEREWESDLHLNGPMRRTQFSQIGNQSCSDYQTVQKHNCVT